MVVMTTKTRGATDVKGETGDSGRLSWMIATIRKYKLATLRNCSTGLISQNVKMLYLELLIVLSQKLS